MRYQRILSLAVLATAALGWLLCPALPYAVGAQPDNTWQPLAGPRGGFVGNLSLSPSFDADRTLYAAAGRSGVYRSTNGGASWTLAGAGQLCGS